MAGCELVKPPTAVVSCMCAFVLWLCGTELVGHNVKMVVPPDIRDQHDGFLEHHNNTSKSKIAGRKLDTFLYRKDGSCFPVYVSLSEAKLKAVSLA